MTPDSFTPEPFNHSHAVPARIVNGQLSGQLGRSIGPTAAAPVPDDGLTPTFVWRVFCQWWTWTVPVGLLLAVTAAAIVWYFHVPIYEAKALIKIESEMPFIAFNKGQSNQNADRYVQTQIELLRSSVVLSPVLSRPEIAEIQEIRSDADPVKFMQKQLSVQQVGQSELYQVSYRSPSPQAAATVTNSTVAEYLIMQDREDRQRSQIVIEELEKERLDRGVKVEQMRKRVVELAKALTGRDPFGQGVVTDMVAFSSASAIYQGLAEAEVGMEMVKAELQALNTAPIVAADKAAVAGLLELEISNRADVRQLETQILAIQEAMTQVKARPRLKIKDDWEKDPAYQQLVEQLRLTNVELQRLKETAGKTLMALRLDERKSERQRLIAAKQIEFNTISKKREMLASKLEKHRDEFKAGGAQSAELEFAKGELDREQKVFELIAARKLALQTEMRAPGRVSLMQKANPPLVALQPIPYKLFLLACASTLLIPLGLSIGYESIVRRVSTPEQLAKESLLPVLGEVARFPMRRVKTPQQALPAAQQRQLLIYAESIDSLRTNLMLTEKLGFPGQSKVIAICSAASGEGKTSVATSLAMSIAEATKQATLVLDADLRAPDVGKFFSVPNHPGVAEVLTGKANIDEVIHRVGTTQAYVLPAGKCGVNPHHVLQGTKIDELLETLRKRFSIIVIDTPPVLSASESLVYAKAADLVVFCSMADVSRSRQVRVAVDRLHSTGAKMGGVVLSGVPFSRYVYQYGNYSQRV